MSTDSFNLRALVFAGILVAVTLIAFAADAQNTRDFPLPDGMITDLSGELTDDEIARIRAALDSAHDSNGMDGYVVVALRTEEWHLEEYVKDYADYLQGLGHISSTGWLLYVSTADRKFALGVQDVAADSITPAKKQEISLIMSERLESGDLSGAIIGAIDAIADLPAPAGLQDKKKVSPDMLIFMGIAIMVIALMFRLRQVQMKKKPRSAAVP